MRHSILPPVNRQDAKRQGTGPPPLGPSAPHRRSRIAPFEKSPMAKSALLNPRFFARSVHAVAPDLIGATLLSGGVGGVIVEVEAYHQTDPAAHSYRGRTPRLCVSLLRHPLVSQFRLRAGRKRQRSSDPGPAAHRWSRRHASTPGGQGRAPALLRAWTAVPGARHHRRCERAPARAPAVRIARAHTHARNRGRSADRNKPGARAAMAPRSQGLAVLEQAVPPGLTARSRWRTRKAREKPHATSGSRHASVSLRPASGLRRLTPGPRPSGAPAPRRSSGGAPRFLRAVRVHLRRPPQARA
jgi:hypothetical protein